MYSDFHLLHQPDDATVRWRLADALVNHRLDVHYQPIVDTTSRRVVCIEALARLPDGFGRWIAPDAFIPVAEQFGYIDTLFEQVAGKALAQLRTWRAAGRELCLGLNVSRLQLRQTRFARYFAAQVETAGLAPETIIVEVTESLPTEPHSNEVDNLQSLAGIGFRLALDDFGAGHANLARLNDFAWHIVKFDRSLIARLGKQGQSPDLMAVLLGMAHGGGMDTIAEGVEDRSTARLLAELGITAMQGHHFFPAMPANECGLLLDLALDEY